MNYQIRVNLFNKNKTDENSIIKGFCNIVFGNSFKVSNVVILQNAENGELFVSMPRYRTNEKDENGNDVFKDICNPIKKEFREELFANIISQYNNAQSAENSIMSINADEKNEPNFSVSVTPYEKEGSQVRGFARIYIDDCFVISNVTLVEGNKGLFISMPSYKTKQVDEKNRPIYQDICYPVTKEFREKLYNAIIDEYNNKKNKFEEQFEEYLEQNMEQVNPVPGENNDEPPFPPSGAGGKR